MRNMTAILFVISVFAISPVPSRAQNTADTSPSVELPDSRGAGLEYYTAIINELFDPVGDRLNLTKEQQFRIVAIISGTEVMSEPLFSKFDEIDGQLARAAISESYDEAKVAELSEQEAILLARLISLKIFAKSRIFKTLTPDQRTLVSQHFQPTNAPANLGAISIY
jgi:hypothetical protein